MSDFKPANKKAHIFIALKGRMQYVRASNDEWVHVHCSGGSNGEDSDWDWKIGLTVVESVNAVAIIKGIAPNLILGLIDWSAPKWFRFFK